MSETVQAVPAQCWMVENKPRTQYSLRLACGHSMLMLVCTRDSKWMFIGVRVPANEVCASAASGCEPATIRYMAFYWDPLRSAILRRPVSASLRMITPLWDCPTSIKTSDVLSFG